MMGKRKHKIKQKIEQKRKAINIRNSLAWKQVQTIVFIYSAVIVGGRELPVIVVVDGDRLESAVECKVKIKIILMLIITVNSSGENDAKTRININCVKMIKGFKSNEIN